MGWKECARPGISLCLYTFLLHCFGYVLVIDAFSNPYIHIPYSYYSNINLFLLFSLCDSLKISVVYFIYVHFCFNFVLRRLLVQTETKAEQNNSTYWFRVSKLRFIFSLIVFWFEFLISLFCGCHFRVYVCDKVYNMCESRKLHTSTNKISCKNVISSLLSSCQTNNSKNCFWIAQFHSGTKIKHSHRIEWKWERYVWRMWFFIIAMIHSICFRLPI